MAGKSYFFSVFAVILLALGLLGVTDPGALTGLLTGILRLVFIILAAVVVVIAIALMFGPQEQ